MKKSRLQQLLALRSARAAGHSHNGRSSKASGPWLWSWERLSEEIYKERARESRK